MANEKLSVKGLANIGQLMQRNPDVINPHPTKSQVQKKMDRAAIVQKTVTALIPHMERTVTAQITHIVEAAVRNGADLGHNEALDQNGAVEAMLEKQFAERNKLAVPAVVAAVMEQLGMTSLVLDLPHVATIFKRSKLTWNMTDNGMIEYRLEHNADKAQ